MSCFILTPHPSYHQQHARLSRSTVSPRRPFCASLSESTEQPIRPRFSRDADDPTTQTRKSFFAEQSLSTNTQTPNDRMMDQVRETMRQLGIDENSQPPSSRPFRPIDISRVNPFSALIGSIGAATISAVAWKILLFVIEFSLAHPLDDQIYIVQRISVVVRTALVCLFALGSGISAVTALGLLMLFFRTAYAAVTGEFDTQSQDDSK